MTAGDVYESAASIIVPVLNAEATIRDLLELLVRVDYDEEKLEIILVDGRSTDKTKEIIKEYPVKLILENRKGLDLARNTGFESSQGEIILSTDSDCVVPRGWARRMVKNFEQSDVGCVGGSVLRYEDNFLSRYADDSIMPVLRKFGKREAFENVEPPSLSGWLQYGLRRSVIEEVGGFDEHIHHGFDEDELVERLCRAGYGMVLDPETTIKHQYRDTFRGFLKQSFNYSRGGALLMKSKAVGRLARWNLLTLMPSLVWLIGSISLVFLASSISIAFPLPLAHIPFVPFALLTLFYVFKGLKEGYYVIAVNYPFTDVLRLMAYWMGELYGMVT